MFVVLVMKERLLDGFKIGETRVAAEELSNDELVVSFLNLPAYIEDAEIVEKLNKWGMTVTSPVKKADVAKKSHC